MSGIFGDQARELERRPRAAGNGRVVSIETRHFDGALLREPTMRVADDVVAVYVEGRLDSIEWNHVREDGLLELHVVPASNVARIWRIRPPEAT
jgi:hypothetical protein